MNIHDSEKNPKLRTYKHFKNEYSLETYLTQNKNLNFPLALLRLRISSHNLRIETGRYAKPHKTPVNERICLYCTQQSVEDESHFIVKCSLYDAERAELYKVVQEHYITNIHMLSEDDIFIQIMLCEEPNVLSALGKYVYTCLKKRNNTVIDM